MYIKTKIFIVFFLILSFVSSVKNVYGITYFFDDFNQDNLNNWTFINVGNASQESWKIVNNELKGEVINGEYSFLLARDFLNLSDYSIRVDALNKSGVDQDIIFRISGDMNDYYMLNIRFRDLYWPQDNRGEIILWKCNGLNCGNYKKLAIFSDLSQINLTQDEFHKIKIEAMGSNIKIYFDSILVINFDDNDNPLLIGSFGFLNWGGNYYARPSINLFDNLIIGDFDYNSETPTPTSISTPTLTPTSTPVPTSTPTPTLTPTPTSTPTPTPKMKIIILPGLGASWNSEAIVYGIGVSNDQWKMTPFVKNYNSLINALKQNGLSEKEDFYVWNYDWRKSLVEIINDLNSFINQNVGQDEKVTLIGHSLGGLTARIWAEDNKNDQRLGKVITLGSPHLGSVEAYEVWNGGQISDLSKISSIAFKVLLKLQGLTTKTDMEAVRKYTPLIKDLLPTFDFVKKNGINLTNDKLETRNIFLKNKNDEGASSTINLKLFIGSGFKTEDSVELKDNNIFDRILGIWPDGRINKFLYSQNGDGTVLTKSADYEKSDFINTESKHNEIVDKTVNQVIAEIGLSQVDVISESQDLSNNLVVFVGSPVDYSVKCDENSPVDNTDGFVVVKNENYKFCNINLVATGDGIVHIVTGNTNGNDWSYWEKKVVIGEINNIKINPSGGQIVNDKNNILFLKSIIKADVNSLLFLNKNNKPLKEALKNLDKNQPKSLMINIFSFRNEKNEKLISEKIIDNSTIWLSLTNKCFKNEAITGVKIAGNYQSLIENLIYFKDKKNLKISENAAISYQKMDALLEFNKEKISQKDYSNVCANNFAALNYGNEVLINAYHKNDFKMWLLNDLKN